MEETAGRRGVDLITGDIIGCAIEVHRELGPGLLESVYERCLAWELAQKGYRVAVQKELPVLYKGKDLECGFRADLIVDGSVLVEIKAAEAITPVYEAQVLTYMRLGGMRTGLLINFYVKIVIFLV